MFCQKIPPWPTGRAGPLGAAQAFSALWPRGCPRSHRVCTAAVPWLGVCEGWELHFGGRFQPRCSGVVTAAEVMGTAFPRFNSPALQIIQFLRILHFAQEFAFWWHPGSGRSQLWAQPGAGRGHGAGPSLRGSRHEMAPWRLAPPLRGPPVTAGGCGVISFFLF